MLPKPGPRFTSDEHLAHVLLGSCYIPLVWESPVWLRGLGPAVDGGATRYLVDGDLVVGPCTGLGHGRGVLSVQVFSFTLV